MFKAPNNHPPHSTTAHCPPPFWGGGTGVRTSPICLTRPTIQNSKSLFCRCKDNFFWLYCQDIVPLHLEITEKIGTIK